MRNGDLVTVVLETDGYRPELWQTHIAPVTAIGAVAARNLRAKDEGTFWLRGHHCATSQEGRALLSAYALAEQ